MSVFDALASGREAAMRRQLERIAKEFDECESLRDLKALSVELRDLQRELAEIEVPDASDKPRTGIDELKARRDAKLRERRSG